MRKMAKFYLNSRKAPLPFVGLFFLVPFSSVMVLCAHSEKAVIPHVCHGHTLQLSTGLFVYYRRLVVSNSVKC